MSGDIITNTKATNIRVFLAIIISFLIHAVLLSMDLGKDSAPIAASIRRKVTVRLVPRKAPDKPVVREVEKVINQADQVFHLPMPKPVVVAVKEIPQVIIPAVPVVPIENKSLEKQISDEIVPDTSPAKSDKVDSPEVVLATPLYRQNPPPDYPARARRRHLQGTVILEVMVSVSGLVESLEVSESSGHKILDRAALQAVENWVFEPGRMNGKIIAMKVMVPVRFSLR